MHGDLLNLSSLKFDVWVLFMFRKNEEVTALTGDNSLTFVFPVSVALQLDVGNREVLKYRVVGDRLIVEKYHSPVTTQTIVRDGDGDSGLDGEENNSEVFNSSLVRSIRKKHANIEKISDSEWGDMENQDSEDVL
jgi:hypothetical protein